jgi:hypothetical protein
VACEWPLTPPGAAPLDFVRRHYDCERHSDGLEVLLAASHLVCCAVPTLQEVFRPLRFPDEVERLTFVA